MTDEQATIELRAEGLSEEQIEKAMIRRAALAQPVRIDDEDDDFCTACVL
jgi:IS5 family transposase